MMMDRSTLNWLLKASLWISANESLQDTFQAIREAKNAIREKETELLESSQRNKTFVYRLLEAVVWTASGERVDLVASNLIEILGSLRADDFDLNGESKAFGETLIDCDVDPSDELSEFWNVRIDSAKERGAAAPKHTLLDYALKTVEVGVHPMKPDLVSFIIGDLLEGDDPESPDLNFPVDIQHRSARVTIGSDQFESIHEKVVWIDDSSGRMGVVGGEPLPVIGQPEGNEAALRLDSDGEKLLQPFDRITLRDGEESIND
jgi:hypothetical protein